MDLDADSVKVMISNIDLYMTPLVIVLGLVGNTTAGILFTFSDLKKIPTVHYLIALSVSDSLYLLALFFKWLGRFDISVYDSAGWCQFFYYILNACQFLSVWFVVCATADRFILHVFPSRRHPANTVLRVKVVVIAFSISAIVIYLNLSLMTGVDGYPSVGKMCLVQPMFVKTMNIIEKFDIVLNGAIPFLGIILLNSVTLMRMCRPADRTKYQNNFPHGLQAASDKDENIRLGNNCGAVCDVTVTLLTVSTIVLGLNLPLFVLRVKQMIGMSTERSFHISDKQRLMQSILQNVYYINFAFKFFLYASVCTYIRALIFKKCCRKCSSKHDNLQVDIRACTGNGGENSTKDEETLNMVVQIES